MAIQQSLARMLLASTALLLGTSPSWAAREFTPQAGLWMIPSEIDGKPGRGFSLDVQGNTAFLQIFNYEKSGAATFHTAVGKLDEQASMTVPLQRFKGGRYFGGPAQDAVSDGSVGNVTVKFSDGLNGTVQFPGESEQPVARYLVPEKLPLWWTQLSDDPPSGKEGSASMLWTTTSKNGVRYFWKAKLEAGGNDAFSLSLRSLRANSVATRSFDCRIQSETRVFDCTPQLNGNEAESADQQLEVQRLKFRMLGRDVVGVIQPAWDLAQRMTLNGWTEGSYGCNDTGACLSPATRSARVFSQDALHSSLCTGQICSGFEHITLQPTSGAWIINDENTGQPGRGVFLDVQDNTLIVQTSDYMANGEPTFHMGVSDLTKSEKRTEPTTSTLPLLQYAGGRYFGGPAQSGHEISNTGALNMSFDPRTGSQYTDFANGTIQLPGEMGSKRMRRLAFEPYTEDMNAMLGEYFVLWSPTIIGAADWLRLTRTESGYAYNEDGTTACRRNSGETNNAFRMVCARNQAFSNLPNSPSTYIALIDITPFNRSASNSQAPNASLIQTRDRHSNWLGLGKVNLPGLAIPAE